MQMTVGGVWSTGLGDNAAEQDVHTIEKAW